MTTDHTPDELWPAADDGAARSGSHERDFWAGQADWPTSEHPRIERARPRPTAKVRGLWDRLLSGDRPAPRAHGTSRPTSAAPATDDLADLDVPTFAAAPTPVAARSVDTDHHPDRQPDRHPDRQPAPHDQRHEPFVEWDGDWDIDDLVEPVPGGRRATTGVDPLLARFGGLAVVVTLLVPLLVALGNSGSDADLVETALASPAPSTAGAATTDVAAAAEPVASPETSGSASTAVDAGTTPAEAAAPSPSEPPATAAAVATTLADEQRTSANTAVTADESIASAAVAESPAERVERVCAIEYEVVSGDFWIRLADGAGVPLAELLEANLATVETPLYPGRVICLPAGSTIPAPPTTVAPTTVPATTAPPATTPPTTAPPATTPPTTAPPSDNRSVEQIIRDVWPDELEERALEIAWRESNHIPTAKNYCCYGLFQIYWDVHKGWLADLGVTSSNQLFDAETNARAAYTLYQRAGGWGPWGF